MSAAASCAGCHHFVNRPAELESLLPGMNTLGSAYGAVRDGDGLCQHHQRYLRATCLCAQHQPVTPPAPPGPQPAALR
jgi:hypothetical protein